ncbi:unnamed protein product [Pleuronectes platessa]|uniref:Uncharacterized protein n=1 Tax=Pleuronectes platessa TaxID=8262 RepID=A0A9N7YDW4_PLEPL|nr:unnamed protein product [Pleuronectes platessa]
MKKPGSEGDSSVPSMESSRYSSVPNMETTKDSSVLNMDTTRHSSVPSMEPSRDSSVPNMETTRDSSVPNMETTRDSSVPNMETTKDSSVLNLETTKDSSLPNMDTTRDSSVPNMDTTRDSSVLNLETARDSPVPSMKTTEVSLNQQCCSCDTSSSRCWCVDCAEALCDDCVSAHRRVTVTRSHRILNQPPGNVSTLPTKFCRLHPSEPLKLFCRTCFQYTCRDCQLIGHMNHRYLFVSDALNHTKKQLVTWTQPIRAQRDTASRSLKDMQTRLQQIKDGESQLDAELKTSFNLCAQLLKNRMDNLMEEVKRELRSESDLIQKQMEKLNQLQKKQILVTESSDRAQNVQDLHSLFRCCSQVKCHLKDLQDQDLSPPETMQLLQVTVDRQSLDTLLNFGKLEVEKIPFSIPQTSNQNPPPTSTCPTPSSMPPSPQTTTTSVTVPPISVSGSSVLLQLLSTQLSLLPASCPNLNQPPPPVTTSCAVTCPKHVPPLSSSTLESGSPPQRNTKLMMMLNPVSSLVSLKHITSSSIQSTDQSSYRSVLKPSLVLKQTSVSDQNQPSTALLHNHLGLERNSALLLGRKSVPAESCQASLSQGHKVLPKHHNLTDGSSAPPAQLTLLCDTNSKRYEVPFTSSVKHRHIPVVKAVADSACDHTEQQMSTRQEEPPENRPTSTLCEEPKPAQSKPTSTLCEEPKPAQSKPTSTLCEEPKPAQSKPTSTLCEEPKPAQSKPTSTLCEEPKPAQSKPTSTLCEEPKPAQSKPTSTLCEEPKPARANPPPPCVKSPNLPRANPPPPCVKNPNLPRANPPPPCVKSPNLPRANPPPPCVKNPNLPRANPPPPCVKNPNLPRANPPPPCVKNPNLPRANPPPPCVKNPNLPRANPPPPCVKNPNLPRANPPPPCVKSPNLPRANPPPPCVKSPNRPRANPPPPCVKSPNLPRANPAPPCVKNPNLPRANPPPPCVKSPNRPRANPPPPCVKSPNRPRANPAPPCLKSPNLPRANPPPPCVKNPNLPRANPAPPCVKSPNLPRANPAPPCVKNPNLPRANPPPPCVKSPNLPRANPAPPCVKNPNLPRANPAPPCVKNPNLPRANPPPPCVKNPNLPRANPPPPCVKNPNLPRANPPPPCVKNPNLPRANPPPPCVKNPNLPRANPPPPCVKNPNSWRRNRLFNRPTFIVSEETEPAEKRPNFNKPTFIDSERTDSTGKRPQTTAEDLSSVIGLHDFCLSRCQPRVSLFRLPLSLLPTQRSLPGVVARDADDEVSLEELDEDCQSHVSDISEDFGDFTEPLSSPESPVTLEIVYCSACGSDNSSIICSSCGRGYHRDCHIPPVGPDMWTEWNCSLCQDLSDPSDPYRSKRPKSPQGPCLSLKDQRRCESVLLHLKVEGCSRLSKVGCVWVGLMLMSERLALHRPPAYQTPVEFVRDVWSLFRQNTSSQDDLMNLRQSFRNKLMETFNSELRPANRKKLESNQRHPESGSTSESLLKKTRKRLREFLAMRGHPGPKRTKTDKMDV